MMQQWQSSESFNHIHINSYTAKDTTNYMSEKQTTNFCSLKKWTLQTSVVLESRHYKLLQSKKADTTNSCSLNKWTLQTFVVQKSGHYKFLQSISYFLQSVSVNSLLGYIPSFFGHFSHDMIIVALSFSFLTVLKSCCLVLFSWRKMQKG